MLNNRQTVKVEISYRTILFVLAVVLVMGFLYQIRVILMQLLVGLVLMTALNPMVNKIENWQIGQVRVNRVAAVVLTYLIGLLGLSLFVSIIAQPLTEQTTALVSRFPQLLEQIGIDRLTETLISQQLGQIGNISQNVFGLVGGVFSNLFNVITTLMIAFYLLLERKQLHLYLGLFLDNPKLEQRLERLIDRLETQMGGWIRAELMLMLIVGVLSFLGFWKLGIPYALALALLAGLLEIVPNIGPVFAAIPAIMAGFLISPLHALGALAWSIVVQQLENHLIVPQLMAHSTGVRPLVTIVALLIGYTLAGVTGAILAVPVILIVTAVLKEFVFQE